MDGKIEGKKDGREEGRTEGRKEGRNEGTKKRSKEGKDEGRKEQRKERWKERWKERTKEGREEGSKERRKRRKEGTKKGRTYFAMTKQYFIHGDSYHFRKKLCFCLSCFLQVADAKKKNHNKKADAKRELFSHSGVIIIFSRNKEKRED